MKRVMFCVLSAAGHLTGSAQNWCTPQALWHHDFTSGQGTVFGYLRTEYVADTILDGSTCQLLRTDVNAYNVQTQQPVVSAPWHTRITRGQGDLVELWYTDQFDTLYWFGALPGDRWHLEGTRGLTVLDTGTLAVAGVPLHMLVVQFDEFWAGLPQDTIVERLGFLNYYWDATDGFASDGGLGALRCYSDTELAYSSSLFPSCDFITSVPGLTPPMIAQVFPDPGSDKVTIEWPGQHGFSVTMMDVHGRRVIERVVYSGSVTLDTSGLSPGCYTVIATTDKGERSSAQWIKR